MALVKLAGRGHQRRFAVLQQTGIPRPNTIYIAVGSISLLWALLTSSVWAKEYQPINYFGLSYMQLNGGSSAGPEYRPNGVLARLGFMTGDFFGLELQSGLSQGSSGFELNNVAAAYIYAGFPYDRLWLFTLAGMARTDIDRSGASEVSQNLSFGFGMRWQMMPRLDLSLEWMNYGERPAYSVGSFNIGFIRHF
ncbi:MAG TPA: hypothetical protein ENJ43_03930 [Gammaproteobacteria bacterium]|nr:hypothetical protein [Gammaproteobacteria bacterium]